MRKHLWPGFAACFLGAAPINAIVLDPNFTETTYVSSADIGLPTGIAWAPDGSGRLFVTRKGGFSGQQNAQVRVVQNGAVLPEVFATESVHTSSECGIIGIAFDPNFITNRFVYFFLTVSSSEQQIVRYTDLADAGQRAASRTVIMAGLPTIGANHDGGAVGIGNDGKLYWAVGDIGNGTGVDGNLTSLASKVGRADRFTGLPLHDNPFYDGPGANADHIWSRGYRNPFTLTFHVPTGQLWVNDVGTSWEQVFVPQPGDHAGWNDYENNQPPGFLAPIIAYRTNGTEQRTIAANGAVRSSNVGTITTTTAHPFRKGAMATISGVANASFNGTFPVASVLNATQFTVAQGGADATSGGGTATTQNIGGALTGGCFYDSTAFPAGYRWNYFFGDYNSGRIMRVQVDANNLPVRTDEFVYDDNFSNVDIATGPDGALYYANQSSPGTIRRLAHNSTSQEIIVHPTALSVEEGGTAVFTVRLRVAPAANVAVTIGRISGDTDLNLGSPNTLTFTPANFATPQLVVLNATADPDAANGGATFRVESAGIATHDVTALEIENTAATWRAQYFPAANDPNRSFTADADLDGELNLFEYFSGSNPTIANLSRAPMVEVMNVGGTEYLTLRFVHAKTVSDVIARVEAGSDLIDGPWTDINPANATYLISVQDNVPAAGLETITVRDVVPFAANPARYLRLRLTKPPGS